MVNDRLKAAMRDRTADVHTIASAAEVDPKTVYRWVAGRIPHPRHRWAVARFLDSDEVFLWPDAERKANEKATAEIVDVYPFRANIPTEKWWELIISSNSNIDLLGYTLYFLPMQHPQFGPELAKKCEQGVSVRAVVANPDSRHVADRDVEEDLAMTLGVRIKTSLKYLSKLVECPSFELHIQDLPLYNSVFRFDDQMIVTPHLHATPGAAAPALHLRRLAKDGLFDRFASHFESVWATTVPATPQLIGTR